MVSCCYCLLQGVNPRAKTTLYQAVIVYCRESIPGQRPPCIMLLLFIAGSQSQGKDHLVSCCYCLLQGVNPRAKTTLYHAVIVYCRESIPGQRPPCIMLLLFIAGSQSQGKDHLVSCCYCLLQGVNPRAKTTLYHAVIVYCRESIPGQRPPCIMLLLFIAGSQSQGKDQVDMMQIDCEILNTNLVHVRRSAFPNNGDKASAANSTSFQSSDGKGDSGHYNVTSAGGKPQGSSENTSNSNSSGNDNTGHFTDPLFRRGHN